jgi:hypothetical protein
MRKLIAVVAVSTVFMLTAPPSASASYWSYGGHCVLTEDGSVILRGFVYNSDGAYFSYGPVDWIYQRRELGSSIGWRRIDRGFRETVTVNPDGTWITRFRSTPSPTEGFAYRLIAEAAFYTFDLTAYNDNKENPLCRTRAA